MGTQSYAALSQDEQDENVSRRPIGEPAMTPAERLPVTFNQQ
jgi:hypothetical protein